MDDLILECTEDKDNSILRVSSSKGKWAIIHCVEFGSPASIVIDKHRAEQLRDWLNKYIELNK
jgi:hypothetical protein